MGHTIFFGLLDGVSSIMVVEGLRRLFPKFRFRWEPQYGPRRVASGFVLAALGSGIVALLAYRYQDSNGSVIRFIGYTLGIGIALYAFDTRTHSRSNRN
jgi:hypothetical protein